MKKLFLLRHGVATGQMPNQYDQDRELTVQGIEDCNVVGDYLKNNYTVHSIIASAALRTTQTALILAHKINYSQKEIILSEELYEASPRILFQTFNRFEDNLDNVLCVGHNPSISYIAEFLTKKEIGSIEPAGLVIIEFDITSWKEMSEGSGTLITHTNADRLRSEEL